MSFFHKIKAWLAKAFKAAPKWETIAAGALTVAAPLLETLLTLTAGAPTATAVGVIIAKIQADMAAAHTLIETAGPSPTVCSVLESIKANLAQLESAAEIKDPKTQAVVTATVDALVSEIDAIIKEMPGEKNEQKPVATLGGMAQP